MSLNYEDKCSIIKNFPKIKFSYENSIHKKVLSDYYYIIPKGKKYFAWFTTFHKQNICFFLEIKNNNTISNITYKKCCFHDSLSYGTILYGTIIFNKEKNVEIFVLENIHYYLGENIDEEIEEKKLNIISTILQDKVKPISFFKQSIVFSIPIIKMRFMDAYEILESLFYEVYGIQYRNKRQNNNDYEFYKYEKQKEKILQEKCKEILIENNRNNYIPNEYNKNKNNNKYNELSRIFKIKAKLQNDIYNLIPLQGKESISELIADIPDYKTSVMMNNLFRNIKENKNLDKLEESDDEEEFENINLDKFVDINKEIKMRCVFNYRTKKWRPIEVVN